MNVRVQWSDIADGKAGKCSVCPIALAIRRITGCPVDVGTNIAALASLPTRGFAASWYYLPRAAVEFVDRFDQKLPVEPFTFTMRLQK